MRFTDDAIVIISDRHTVDGHRTRSKIGTAFGNTEVDDGNVGLRIEQGHAGEGGSR